VGDVWRDCARDEDSAVRLEIGTDLDGFDKSAVLEKALHRMSRIFADLA
jgi:hypothetical protein